FQTGVAQEEYETLAEDNSQDKVEQSGPKTEKDSAEDGKDVHRNAEETEDDHQQDEVYRGHHSLLSDPFLHAVEVGFQFVSDQEGEYDEQSADQHSSPGNEGGLFRFHETGGRESEWKSDGDLKSSIWIAGPGVEVLSVFK